MFRYPSQHRYLVLLVSLLLLLVIPPFVGNHDRGPLLLAVIWSGVLLSAVWGVSGRAHLLAVSLALALPALAADWAFQATGHRWLAICELGAGLSFLGLTTVTIVVAVASDDSAVTGDTIAGAVCGYLLLSVVWGLAFCLMERLQPGSFSLANRERVIAQHAVLPDLLRYSMATATTLGSSSIQPASPQAETLTALEAITGQLYLAVLIARLVGLHTTRSRRR
jgi:hypothetical protein